MEINIIQLSIAITLSFVAGNIIYDFFREVIGRFITHVARELWADLYKPKFVVYFPSNHRNNKIVSKQQTIASNAVSMDLKFLIKSEVKFPLFFIKGLEARVQIGDPEQILKIQLLNKFSSLPHRWDLGKFIVEPNIVKEFSILISPLANIQNYKIPIWIFYRGKGEKYFLEISKV